MNKRIVIALGGNAILTDNPTAGAQQAMVRDISESVMALLKDDYQVAIVHGNGPQVGNLHLQQRHSHSSQNPALPLDSCVAMTQGSMGYWLQNALGNAQPAHGLSIPVVSVITQVAVDAEDPAFLAPTKPIGPFMSQQEAKAEQQSMGGHYMEDAGRGWRKAVASPKPIGIVEREAILQLLDSGALVVCCGGGGIPVIRGEAGYQGVEAVIDKDLASELLAKELEADTLLFLTGVDTVFINYGKQNQQALHTVDTRTLHQYMEEGQFAAGSMLPKVQAALRFAASGANKRTVITSIAQAGRIDAGQCTQVVAG